MKNINRLLIGTLSCNFDQPNCLLQGKVDILVLTESKFDSSLPKNQFLIRVYSRSFRFVRNRNGGVVLLYTAFCNLSPTFPS